MYVVHNRSKDIWSIVPDSIKDTNDWYYVLTEEELSYIKDEYTLFYNTLYTEVIYQQ